MDIPDRKTILALKKTIEDNPDMDRDLILNLLNNLIELFKIVK